MNTISRLLPKDIIINRKLNASITVEAAFSFTITIFILFLMVGPLLIIKTSSDILLTMNKASKARCTYEMIKEGTNDIEKILEKFDNIPFYLYMASDLYNIEKDSGEEYKNIKAVYDLNPGVYDEETGIVRYDYAINFELPYNLLFISNIRKRLIINRRAFIGAVGDRFNALSSDGDYVYVANNYINSSVYHTNINCTYLIKNTECYKYSDVKSQRNENNEKYTKCNYCFKKVKLKQDTNCYITRYGDKYHYRSNCPLMTAYVTKIPREYIEQYNLRECSKCMKKGDK